MAYSGKKSVRLLSLLLALVMVFVCGTTVLAESADGAAEENTATEGSATETVTEQPGDAVPDPSANFYIHDEEKLLSNETKNAILDRNKTLYEKYGIQIIVLSLAEIPGAEINAKGAYLHQIIDSWQVGGTDEKCLVLMVSSAEQNYVAVAGDGLSHEFPVATWSDLFTQYLEPDFAAQQYDAGVLKIFNAMADKAELYAVNTGMTASGPAVTPTPEPAAEEEEEDKEKLGFFTVLMRVIGAILGIAIIVVIVGLIVIYTHGQMVKKKRREARRRKAMQERAQKNDYNDFINRY